ncbi:MAG TPA: alpha-galactosidase, partial [Vicinamibacterales bacterium]|nr:alpha-galactosidase [Vicinamibacterales bacterium]
MVLDEHLRDGRLCTRYWSSSGQIWPEMHIGDARWEMDQPADAFHAAINGQALAGGLRWAGAAIEPDPSGYRNDGGHALHGVITLVHDASSVEVKVHTRLDGGPFIIRWLELTNRSPRAVAVTAAAPFGGMLWNHRADESLPSIHEPPFELAYARQFTWGCEGEFRLEPLATGVTTVDGGKLGKSGWGRPAFWVRNRCNGQTFVCELAWGGNYAFSLDCRTSEERVWGRRPAVRWARLFFRMGLAGWDQAIRVLLPGEAAITPAVHLGLFQCDADAIVDATHEHVRSVVMPAPIPGRELEIEANHRGYLCDHENEPDLRRDADVAASIGTELYVIDAGWYGNDPNQWWRNAGDWRAGSWLPNGLEPVAEHAHKLGMRFGLWVEIEAAGENSTLHKEHPDWLLSRDGQPIAGGRALDLTKPEAAAWCES